MNCEEIQERISQYIDGELQPDQESELFWHLSVCGHCREFSRSALNLRSELSMAPAQSVPRRVDEQVYARTHSLPLTGKSLTFERALSGRRQFSFRALALAVVFSVITSVAVVTLWYRSIRPQPTYVCLTPLPEVEVTAYEITGHPLSKGHQE
jgi:anti-sigma factor RsiW